MDKDLIRRRFARMLDQYNKMAVVQKEIADELAHELDKLLMNGSIFKSESRECLQIKDSCGEEVESKNVQPDIAAENNQELCIDDCSGAMGLEIGAGTGFMTKHLLELYPNYKWYINDISHESGRFINEISSGAISFIEADGEALELGHDKLDLVVSTSALQWFRDLPTFFAKVMASLRSGGVLAFSTFGPENFIEITSTTGNTLVYYSREQLDEILRVLGFEIISSRDWLRSLEFNTPLEVLHHIKSTGVNAINSQKWTHSRLQEFESMYRGLYNPISLTFHPILIVARKR